MFISNSPHRVYTNASRLLRSQLTRRQPIRRSSRAVDAAEALHQEELRQQTISNGFDPNMSEKKKTPAVPRPSASVMVISPNNQILLLQRVKQSSSFPSAHVFPGGNVAERHDGRVPDPPAFERHEDSEVYRMCAIRECFEESGILLARNNGFGRLIEVPESEREEGRKAIHSNKITFPEWLAKKGGRADIDGLIPFTRWVTPTNVPKRFTTQMYLYFLPTMQSTSLTETSSDNEEEEVKIPLPTTDGGLEHTTARFLPASVWLRLAQEGRIIMFPPQFFLLHQIAQHFDNIIAPTAYGSITREQLSRTELETGRQNLRDFVKTGQPPWTDKVISPIVRPAYGKKRDDTRSVLSLENPGPELKGSTREGEKDQVVLVNFRKEGPRHLAVVSREQALGPKL